jgi:hypothetical protein
VGWVCFRGAGAFRRMLSSDSLLFARNSGCLNSHAFVICVRPSIQLTFEWEGDAYILSIWRLAIFFIVLSHLVEVVFVQLAYKTGKVAVFKMFR